MKWKQFTLSVFLLTLAQLSFADVNEAVYQLQKRWAQVNYTLKDKAQNQAFEELIQQADNVVNHNPKAAEAYIWRGIIKSSFAGAKGGLGAMSLAKSSKADLEHALSIDENALSGSALTSLGTLYFKVPGWPIGFGDDDKAQALLEKAIKINPNGIDSNYFYGEFLIDQRDYAKAEQFLLKAQQAPARPNRPLADKGRQDEIAASLNKVRTLMKPKKNPTGISF
ncbi:MAG: hypothetical protein P1P93_04735 [Gammaproteobacteria bacterium]|nr:hypothetical protein [Gammaproteobacteria bacterium]MDT8371460.1 hypothetical protein [Gammaproteobacteria bacterium]